MENNKCCRGCGEIGTLIHCWWKYKMALIYDPVHTAKQFYSYIYMPQRTENVCSCKNLYLNVHSSFIHNSQKLETTRMFISLWMDKQNVVYPHSWVLFSHKLINIRVVSSFWLLWITLLCTTVSGLLFGHLFAILWYTYLGVELMDFMGSLCLSFQHSQNFSHKLVCSLNIGYQCGPNTFKQVVNHVL